MLQALGATDYSIYLDTAEYTYQLKKCITVGLNGKFVGDQIREGL